MEIAEEILKKILVDSEIISQKDFDLAKNRQKKKIFLSKNLLFKKGSF